MALSADKQRVWSDGDINELPVLGSTKIFEGSATGMQASTGSYIRPLVAGDRFCGFSLYPVDNSLGASGAVNARLRRKGYVKLTVVGADATKQGASVYASDDDTFTLTATSNSKIGWIDSVVSGTTCIVYFDANLANSNA